MVRGHLTPAAECPACPCLPLFTHTVLHMPSSCHSGPSCYPRQHPWPDLRAPRETAFHQPLCCQPQAGKEPRILWAGRLPITMVHRGLKPAPALALALMLPTGQAYPEPRDDRRHRKEKKQSHRPVAVWQCAERPPGHAGCPYSQPSTHGCSKKSQESWTEKRCLASPLVLPPLLWGLVASGRECGREEGREVKRRQHRTSEIHNRLSFLGV